MERLIFFAGFIFLKLVVQNVVCNSHSYIDNEIFAFLNRTTPTDRQLYDFGLEHSEPIGVLTTSSGLPVEVRDAMTGLNFNQYKNQFQFDYMTSTNHAEIPKRVIQSKGTGVWGYFRLNNDVSMYTSADIFNGAGKITPAFVRFSSGMGTSDLFRSFKAMSVKLYTREGNLDFLNLNMPFFFLKDPAHVAPCINAVRFNPKTFRIDYTMFWDFTTRVTQAMTAMIYYCSDYGLSNGYRKADYFPIHTYELHNKHGERHFVRFNFRTCQGIENLSNLEAQLLESKDANYFNRDLYDAIEEKKYPAWDVEMDVMTYEEVLRCDFDPFDITRLWTKGAYRTVPIGRLVLNRNPENYFKDVEQSAFSPANLVPGIPGPIDAIFRTRGTSYRDAQAYRLGINFNNIHVNSPLYRKTYNRNGVPPVLDNMKGAPVYLPNSFNGPVPYVEESRPKDSLSVLQSKAVDLEPIAYFYHNYVANNEMQKERFLNNTIGFMLPVAPFIQKRVIYLYSLINPELGRLLSKRLLLAEQSVGFAPPQVLIPDKRKILYMPKHST